MQVFRLKGSFDVSGSAGQEFTKTNVHPCPVRYAGYFILSSWCDICISNATKTNSTLSLRYPKLYVGLGSRADQLLLAAKVTAQVPTSYWGGQQSDSMVDLAYGLVIPSDADLSVTLNYQGQSTGGYFFYYDILIGVEAASIVESYALNLALGGPIV